MRRSAEISAGLLAFRRECPRSPARASGRSVLGKKGRRGLDHPERPRRGGADLLATAQREFAEETNLAAIGDFLALTPVKQKSGKLVHAWAFEADLDLATFASNTFEIEWPPRSGRRQSFPGDRPGRLLRAADRHEQDHRLSAAVGDGAANVDRRPLGRRTHKSY